MKFKEARDHCSINNKREATKIFVDNKATIASSNNLVFHGRTKHFKIKYHFIREVQKKKEVILVHCKTKDKLVDILTKALPKIRFEELRKKMGVVAKVLTCATSAIFVLEKIQKISLIAS